MKNKYRLSKTDFIEHDNVKLYRVIYYKWFSDNLGIGKKGGYIESEKNLSQTGDARVWGSAQIWGDARIIGDARVWGSARVSGNAEISGSAEIWGNARISSGIWKTSPIQIQGTKHCLSESGKGRLYIGYLELTIEEWLRDYKKIGESNGYTSKEIEEYHLYILLFKKLMVEE